MPLLDFPSITRGLAIGTLMGGETKKNKNQPVDRGTEVSRVVAVCRCLEVVADLFANILRSITSVFFKLKLLSCR